MATKQELIDAVSTKVEGSRGDPITRADVERVVNAATEVIADHLGAGVEVVLGNNVGRFVVEHRDARQGMNPATGEAMTIPAKNVVKFKPSKQLKERVA